MIFEDANQWPAETNDRRKSVGVHQVDSNTSMQSQIDTMAKEIRKLALAKTRDGVQAGGDTVEKESEEQKGQGSGVRKEIEESRHMPALPFPQTMKREKLDKYFGRFLEMLKQIYVNIPFMEVLTQMPAYAKFLKEILSSKRKLEKTTVVKLNAHCSAILPNKIPQKCGDPGSFTIPCSLWSGKFDKALCNFSASIKLMPLSVFIKLEGVLGVIKSISVSLQLVDQTTILPEGIIEHILVRVDKFVFPVDFIVVDMEVNKEVPLILGRPFLCTCKAILDIYEGNLMLRDKDPTIKKEAEALEIEDQAVDEERLKEEASKHNVELKVLPTYLKYAFLDTHNFSVIIYADLIGTQKRKLVELLKKHKKAIG
uniref:Uncharacterized protein n=1 Tax=Nicotiana tabacum TaxID=4097 RepID=A0A1S4BUV6_TOBAC|nr:PREDICTED: uncharacterized protein LOC107812148 [Nicotiana tabacum]